MPRPKAFTLHKTCERCGTGFDVPDKVNYRDRIYCTRACSNAATAKKRADSIRANGKYSPPVCPCGKEIEPPAGQDYVYARQKKYCSAECRMTYGAKRQKDPSKWETFACGTCGKEVTRRKGYGSSISGAKYCSNACAQKHTKVVKHYVLREDDMVVDSTWEALVVGLLGFLKIPVERVDRSTAVEWTPGQHYAPDLYLPGIDVYVEVKGAEDPTDHVKWDCWREQRGPLAVLGERGIELVRTGDRPTVLGQIAEWARLAGMITVQR
jgi:hypothetical protein